MPTPLAAGHFMSAIIWYGSTVQRDSIFSILLGQVWWVKETLDVTGKQNNRSVGIFVCFDYEGSKNQMLYACVAAL